MDNKTIIILVVAVLVIIAIMYVSKSKTQVAAAPPVVNQAPANFWSSLEGIAGILGALGVGSGSQVPPPTGGAGAYRMVNNSDTSDFITTQEAASNGLDYLVENVNSNDFEMDGTQFN